MHRKIIGVVGITLALCFILTAVGYTAEKESFGTKFKNFWQRLFSYPANVAQESVNVVADTGKRGTQVATKEVKRVGEVTSGDVAKTKELVMEPLTGTAETAKAAVEGVANVPAKAAKEQ